MPEGNAIGFNTFVDKATRSVNDPSYSSAQGGKMFTNFGVFGTVEGAELFDDVTVSGSGVGENASWTYTGTQYWIAGAKYNFAAVAPQTVVVDGVDTPVYTNAKYTVTSAGDGADKTYSGTTTLSFVNNGTTDLLYAEATAEGKAGSGNAAQPANGKVQFNFRHVLSKVKFTFTNLYNASNATIRVENVQIRDAYESGVAKLNAATAWAPESNGLILNFGNAAVASADAEEAFACNVKKESYNELLMIPGAGATKIEGKNVYTVQFDVVLLVSGQEIDTYTHTVYTTFAPEAGKAYNIATSITPENIDPEHNQEPIEFTVNSLGGWDNGNTVDSTPDDEETEKDYYPLN